MFLFFQQIRVEFCSCTSQTSEWNTCAFYLAWRPEKTLMCQVSVFYLWLSEEMPTLLEPKNVLIPVPSPVSMMLAHVLFFSILYCRAGALLCRRVSGPTVPSVDWCYVGGKARCPRDRFCPNTRGHTFCGCVELNLRMPKVRGLSFNFPSFW